MRELPKSEISKNHVSHAFLDKIPCVSLKGKILITKYPLNGSILDKILMIFINFLFFNNQKHYLYRDFG